MPLVLLLLSACNTGFDAVAIRPIYGWTDGCTPVEITGRGFGEDVSATVGGKKVSGVTLPAKDTFDYGYSFTATVPSTDTTGYADVTVTTGDKSATITGSGAYYYIQCPGPGTMDGISPSTGVKAGDTVTVLGCGLRPDLMQVRLFDANLAQVGADLPLTTVCGGGQATFTVPANPDGAYRVALVNANGLILSGAPCLPGDTADTAYSCSDFPLVYGGAQ